ncbi:unnamed protein product [Lymnaea stagnalis]|uniref:Uncharacterized protein n=1 Tax=Lymnaea stagnalis TaxID=6523 RepID=A0AAV2HTG3_LYMST
MGVPKFYRWISERYPCLSEVVKEFQLPEFDNLYLDMNGVIHVCSHPDDENPHFRITEEKIFKDICHYIDFLFRMIKPKKVFFMAVDGVAPRAKMNQQRGRRFRSAREAELLIQKAQERGETLPTEQRFDSNCITPGTPFMVRLQDHLKYFVVDKITHDPLWQGPKVYLSGHETPGEGEHKIMDYIRYSKSQSDHDPDTRHCLYGLDADLIMLGLTSHEPHFSLLREEVRFGGRKDKNKRPVTPEETTFHLLHLSLMRDYLSYEFSSLKGKLPFEWNLENIIDDWILMGFLVGNDFIPHLPHLHIHADALPLLWRTYMNVLPQLDGYINEAGHLNLPRFEKYMAELSKFDEDTFESAFSDLRYLESKLGGKSINESAGASRQAGKLKKLKPFIVKQDGVPFAALEDESKNNVLDVLPDEDSGNTDDDSDADDEQEDDDEDLSDEDEEDYNTFGDEFRLHKRDYYMNKMSYTEVTPNVLEEQAHGYVIAIQWILLYYFDGCPSWSWFYPHHYAPYISDVRGFSDMTITFDLSKPFLPFHQLMAVLPAASKELLPLPLQLLMTDSNSPIVDFYPVNFETDLNGKQQDWEAVVLIPFIEEKRLLETIASKEHLLTKEERERNRHGPHFLYYFTPDNQGFYPSSLPGVFPDLHLTRAKVTELDKDMFRIDVNRLRKGLLDSVRLHVYFPGFPKLRFLPHTHELAKCGCKVFQHNSRGENMLLRIQSKEGLKLEEIADELLGKETYVGWPHLHEAKVIAVANETFKIELLEEFNKKGKKEAAAISFSRKKLTAAESAVVGREAISIKERHMDRFAIDVGNTEIVIYASPLTGKMYTYGALGTVTLEKQFASNVAPYLHQMTVKDLEVDDKGPELLKTLDEVFPPGCDIFMIGTPHYGAQGKVKEILHEHGRIRICLDVKEEPDFRCLGNSITSEKYLNNYQAAQQIGIDGHIMSRITGSVFVEKSGPHGGKANIGLNLKFTKREEEVPGYTKKLDEGWVYSFKCVKAVEEYIDRFPDLWLSIQQQKSNSDIYTEAKLFPEGSSSKLSDVIKYLEDLPCTKAPRMKFGAEILSEDRVKEIEEMTAALNPVPDIVKMKVKPRLLFRPMANQGSLVPDPDADFFLYDRIVVVKAGYSVPFGKRGTIIGIPKEDDGGITPHSLYDVVFDEPFLGGINLRCSQNKGYRVPGSAMLNLTFGEFRKSVSLDQRAALSRNSARMQQTHSSERSSYNGHGSGFSSSQNNNNAMGQRQPYGDRGGGAYSDRTALWKQQQQQYSSRSFQNSQFHQQPVRWENGQPTFGQVFGFQSQGAGKSQGVTPPKFVTPKVQGPQTVMHNTTTTQDNRGGAENSEFDSIWKNLQSHKHLTQGSKSSEPLPQLQGLSALQQQKDQPALQQPLTPQNAPHPRPIFSVPGNVIPASSPAVTSAGTHSLTPVSVQSLFDNASRQKTVPEPREGPENAEFLAMFNTLKFTAEAKQSSNVNAAVTSLPSSVTVPRDTKSSADLALKQLLKIGVEATAPQTLATATTTASETTPSVLHRQQSPNIAQQAPAVSAVLPTGQSESRKSPGIPPACMRQVSLQELFDEAKNHQQLKQPPVSESPKSGQTSSQVTENRDPIAELEVFCKTRLNQGTPQFDYKTQPKQNGYIANVILSNGHRFEGSLCKTRAEAAKSAASMALLCLNSRPNLNHPLLTGFMPGAQRPNVNRFFSINSAFSPIGLPGPNPSLLPRHPPVSAPMLLTPQHFINQPPPSITMHHLFQQQQQIPYQSTGHHTQNFGREHPNRHPQQRGPQNPSPHSFQGQAIQGHLNGGSSQSGSNFSMAAMTQAPTTTGSSSVSQQFIPLQVSRNQKHPNKRRESESDSQSVGDAVTHTVSSSHHEELLTKETATPGPPSQPAGNIDPTAGWKENTDRNGMLSHGSQPSVPSSSIAVPGAPSRSSVQSGDKKKKSRIAAKFVKK